MFSFNLLCIILNSLFMYYPVDLLVYYSKHGFSVNCILIFTFGFEILYVTVFNYLSNLIFSSVIFLVFILKRMAVGGCFSQI